MQNVANRVLLVLVVLGSWSFCLAQGNFLKDIKREGEVISSGNNTTPVGPLKATTYRLEIVRLKEPFQSEHEKPPFEQVFRLTIRVAERLPMEVFSIWIDGRENVAVQVGPKSVAMLIYSRTLPNGVPLALSIQGKKELTSRSVLPETLFVPSEYATPLEDLEARQPVVKLRRLPKTIEIRIEFPGGGPPPDTNYSGTTVEIEGFDPGPDRLLFSCGGGYCVYWIPHEEFDRIANGAEIRMKFHTGNDTRTTVIGRLDKSTIR